MQVKKIAIINNGFDLGGIEMASVASANYFCEKGYQVYLISVYQSKHAVYINPNISVYEPQKKVGPSLKAILYSFFFIRKVIKDINPDVVVAHSEWTNGFVYMALLGLNIRIFFQDHMNPDIINSFSPIRFNLNKYAYKRANGIIALSEYSKEKIAYFYGAKNICVIENPIRELNVTQGKEENRILCVGRLSKEKGHVYLIDAFKKCNKKDWYLDIVGDGPEMDNLKRIAIGNSNIVFHGFQSDINPFLSKSKIFVLPSLSECYPLALIEAMSVGKCCISTDCLSGKNTIAINGQNALVVPPGDSNALSKALIKVINDSSLREKLAINAIRIKSELTPQKIYEKYLDFILP